MQFEIRISHRSDANERPEILTRYFVGCKKYACEISRDETKGTPYHATIFQSGVGPIVQYFAGKRVAWAKWR